LKDNITNNLQKLDFIDFLTLLFIGFYYVTNPPFIKSGFQVQYSSLLNILEITIIGFLLIRVFPIKYSAICIIFFIGSLYFYTSIINQDSLKNVLEKSSIGLSIFIVYQLLKNNKKLLAGHTILWIGFSIFSSISAILMLIAISFFPEFITPVKILNYEYNYLHIPIGGYFLLTGDGFPRFCGYFFEPIVMGMFFSLNIIISDYLIISNKRKNVFLVLSIIGGICTFSFGFFIIIILFGTFKVIQNKSINVSLIFFTFISSFVIYYFETFISGLTSYKLFSRFNRYLTSFEILQNSSILHLIHGYGDKSGHLVEAHASINVFLTLILFHGIILGPIIILIFLNLWSKNNLIFLFSIFYSFLLFFLFYPIISIGLLFSILVYERSKTGDSSNQFNFGY